jgi:DNA-binding beta-propeller fold protein YncE
VLRRVPTWLLLAVLAPVAVAASQSEPGALFRTRRGGPTLAMVARARTGIQPKSVNVSPDGSRVITCNFGRPDAHSVSFFDAYTLEAVGEASFAGNAVESVFRRDGSRLYVSNFRRHVVEVLDPSECYRASPEAPCALSPIQEIPVGQNPKFMALSPDETLLYVANYTGRSVSVVDLTSGVELRRLRTERHPRGMVVRPDGTLLVAAFHGDVIHVFPPGASEESTRWESCALPRHLLLSPDAATLYVTCSMGTVGFYDAAGGERLGLAPVGRNPRSIAIGGDGRYVGAANFSSHDVSVVDTVARTHRTYEVEGAHGVVGLALHPGPGVRLYATSWDTNEVLMLTDEAAEAAHPSGTRADSGEGHEAETGAPAGPLSPPP